MTRKTFKQKRKQYYLNCEIEFIDVDKISTDTSALESSSILPDDGHIVETNVKLYKYDEAAPPLLVFPHPKLEHCYHLIDGFRRMKGARENNSIEQLPCIVLDAKNLVEARLIAAKYNASVHNIREKKNLAYYIIETLDKSYKNRKLTKDLSIPNDELIHLAHLSGESETTCNRALAVFRGIFNELISENPNCSDAGLENCFLDAIKSGKYPELEDFYKKGISVLSFSDRFFERVNKISSGTKKADRQQKQKTTRVARMLEHVTDNYTIAVAAGDDAHKIEANLPITSVNSDSNTNNREIEFLNQLKAMSSIDEIDLPATKKLIQDFLLNNPKSKEWVNLFFNCVSRYWNEFQLFLIGESESPKISRQKQIAKLVTADNIQTDDGQQLLF